MIIEKNRYLIKARVDIGTYFGAKPEEGWVELREPNTRELMAFKAALGAAGNDKGAQLLTFADLLPLVLIDHSFYRDEKTKYTTAEFAEVILEKIDLFSEVVAQYSDKVLFILTPAETEPGKMDAEPPTA